MRIGLFYSLILLLVSCTDTPVEIKQTTFSSFATLQILDPNTISKNQTVTFSMATAYRDGQVSRVAIYNESSCANDSSKVGEITNQVGATVTSPVLIEGIHTFFYKPMYTIPEASLTALCLPSSLTYTVDRTAPNTLGISRTTASPTVDRNVGLSISGCDTANTGASSFLFTESATPIPIGSEPGWEPCTATKIFTVSAAQTTKNIYAFAKDFAGNISGVSSAASVTLTSNPNISTTSTTNIFYVNAPITPIVFTNVGGPISSCSTDLSLPAGLVFNTTTCEITGAPSAPQSPTSYTVGASGSVGSSAFVISIQVKPRPIAIVTFNALGAGPGITTATSSGGQTYNTLLSATVSGADVTAYKFALNTPGTTTCGAYSTPESATGVPIVADLAGLDGPKTLCVLGKNAADVWQATPTVVSWVQGPLLQNLTTNFLNSKTINIDNQPALSVVTTRSFLVGTANSSISCSGCSVRIVDSAGGGTFLPALSMLASTDKVQFQINTAAAGTNAAVTFVFNSVSPPFTLNVKSAPSLCIDPARRAIFLTQGTINGSMGGTVGGIAGADSFCKQQAESLGFPIPLGGYKALLSSSTPAAVTGLMLLGSTINYCDYRTSLPIISSRTFQNPFFNFLNNIAVNGGDSSEWQFIPNAPRNITSTEFWYGNDTGCNCGNWTTDSTTSTCSATLGSATGGRLTFDSQAPSALSLLPNSGVIGGCSEKKHLVCFDPSP